jgi:hypothetical protein
MSESRAFEVGFDRPNLTYEVVLKNKKEHPKQLGELIETRFRGQSGIIYCLSKVGARSKFPLSFDVSTKAGFGLVDAWRFQMPEKDSSTA